MNFKTTIILSGLLILVFVGFLIEQQYGGKPGESVVPANPLSGSQLFDVKSQDITRLSITDSKGNRTTLQKTDGQWRLIEPVKAATVDYKANELLDAIVQAKSMGQPSADPGASAGLDKPRYHVEMITSDAQPKTLTLDVGNITGVGDQMYARVNSSSSGGDSINLVSSDLDKSLKDAANTVRDKHLFAVHATDVRQFKIDYDNKPLMLDLESGKWQITQPEKLSGDLQTIPSFLTSVTAIEATDYLKPGDTELMFARFDHPTLKLWLSDQAPMPQTSSTTVPAAPVGGVTMTVGSADSLSKEHYFVQMSDGQIAKISKDTLTLLKKTPLDFRDRDIVTIPTGQVTRVSILKETFNAPAPATRPATVPAATTVPATQSVLSEATQAVSATTRAIESVLHDVATTTQPASSHLVVLTKRVIVEPPEIMGPPPPAATQPTTLASTQASATMPTTKPEPQSVWQLADDPKAQLDDARIQGLLSKFSPLHADKWLEKVPDAQPLQRYVVEVTAEPGGGNPIIVHKFTIIKTADSPNWVASYNGETFQVSSDLLDALDADYHQGAVLPPPPMTGMPPGMSGMGGM